MNEINNSIDSVEESKRWLTIKILNVTMLIRDKYPELSKYIEEMPVTIPSDNEPEITLKKLQDYFDSLYLIVHNYKLERSTIGN